MTYFRVLSRALKDLFSIRKTIYKYNSEGIEIPDLNNHTTRDGETIEIIRADTFSISTTKKSHTTKGKNCTKFGFPVLFRSIIC